jgi:hypothetical protein
MVLIDEHHTTKTCPCCGRQYKPRGRVYCCPDKACGLVAHRDIVESVNILSRYRYGEVAKILPPPLDATKYRHPVWIPRQGKRSRLDTPELAPVGTPLREAATLEVVRSVTQCRTLDAISSSHEEWKRR